MTSLSTMQSIVDASQIDTFILLIASKGERILRELEKQAPSSILKLGNTFHAIMLIHTQKKNKNCCNHHMYVGVGTSVTSCTPTLAILFSLFMRN